MDQYWLFQTSFNFKITSNLLLQLERLFIVKEKLQSLMPKLQEKQEAIPTETNEGWGEHVIEISQNLVKELLDFCRLRYFDKLAMHQSNLQSQHEWHVLMLLPDDVDKLLESGHTTDEIDELSLFYKARLKDQNLDSLLMSVEHLLKEYETYETAA